MATVQERLQINRTPLDKWSIREQLCLASAVSCSGDQNWMSVSRTLKVLCGSSKDSLNARPADWFSQKNCAVQYGQLLEDVETPKRKKRTSESSASSSSPAPAEPPTEVVLRRLTEERMQELKMEMKKQQEEYAKLYTEIKAVQSGQLSDEQLLQMWGELEKEQDMLRIEEMKMENQMREREFRKQELQRSWRTGTAIQSNSSSSGSLKSSTDTTTVDMDVEEIIGTGKPVVASNTNSTQVSSTARSTAPTITNLLTGGSIPIQNQPAIIPSRDDARLLLRRPISGLPADGKASPLSATQQQLLSPSQSAPTLSMLLEKNKNSTINTSESKLADPSSNTSKNVESSILSDSNNESIPMDIEEDMPNSSNDQSNDLQADIDDNDPNEVIKLMEVFKNIGNIDELDIDVSAVIDEEDVFLKGVDDDEPVDENTDSQQIEDKTFEPNLPTAEKDIKALGKEQKREFASSDDSNDNLPLAAVASLESSSKDVCNESSNDSDFLKEQDKLPLPKNESGQVGLKSDSTALDVKQEMLDESDKTEEEKSTAGDIDDSLKHIDDNSVSVDVFVVPSTTEEMKSESAVKSETEESLEVAEGPHSETRSENEYISGDAMHALEQSENTDTQPSTPVEHNTESSFPKLQPPPSISIADTDENSSSTDISVPARKDEKHSHSIRGQQRKSPHESKTDDEMPNPATQMAGPSSSGGGGALTPRPTALRKLRDRDRSESPMIDDETTTHSDHSTTTNQRSRRRYSSTPVIDSIPNSPASSDRDESRDLRNSKKSLLSIYNVLQSSKHATVIQSIVNNDTTADKLIYRPLEFMAIKKNIECGSIRNVYELQRDIMLMCQNAIMLSKANSPAIKSILSFQKECQNIREFMSNGCDFHSKPDRDVRDNKSSGSTSSSTGGGSTSKGRSGSRKSLRLS